MIWKRSSDKHKAPSDRDRRIHRLRDPKAEPPDEMEELLDGDEAVELPVADELDLHTFKPDETASVVEAYLEEAQRKGFTTVRLIHGRGTGTQREIVRSVLSRSPQVVSFRDASPERGGWGATLVELGPAGAGEAGEAPES